MWALLFFLFALCYKVDGLQCWHCVGPDCGTVTGPSAKMIECDDGQACEVTQLVFYDLDLNVSKVQVPIRGCSWATGCMAIVDPTPCLEVPNELGGMGCTTTKCCMLDGCNPATKTLISMILILLAIIYSEINHIRIF
ncbi:unnamed protein product, partial [Mesorhabditis spiculigera]